TGLEILFLNHHHVAAQEKKGSQNSPPCHTVADRLLDDLRYYAGADGSAAFADRKTQLFVHRDRRDQLYRDRHVIPGHHHLHVRRQLHYSRYIRGAEIKLRTITLEKRRMPST